MNRKNKSLITISIIFSVFIIISGFYIYSVKSKYNELDHPVVKYDDSNKIEYIAEPILKEYIKKYDTDMAYYNFKNSQLIAGNNNIFAISVIFEIAPKDKENLGTLEYIGECDSSGIIQCDLTLIIRKIDDKEYRLIDVVQTSKAKESLGIYQNNKSMLETDVSNEQCKYKVQEDNVYITYNGGNEWIKVPVPFSQLTLRDDNKDVNDRELSKGSYYISQEKTAFIYGFGCVYFSDDKGKTWNSIELNNDIASIRKMFVGFTKDGFGYAAIAGDRAMSFEVVNVYTSLDGGSTWNLVGPLSKEGSSLINGITFATDKIGFVTSKVGDIKLTKNGGENWNTIELPIPDNLKMYYDTPEAPIFNGSHGEIYVGQGEDADYGAGDKQGCKLVTEDNGLTWRYDGEVIK